MPSVDLSMWGAAAAFAAVFPALSFLINRRLCKGHLRIEVHELAFMAALTFLIAVLFEAGFNPLYAHVFHEKLWEYRLLPLHDRNVSALALLVWTAYGVHLYFMLQSLEHWLHAQPRRNFYAACLIGLEAPLLWEVCGNGFFLLLLNEYYAYYHPGELHHFTSLRVIPVYVLCIYVGLLIHARMRRYARDWRITGLSFGAGLVFLAVG